MPYLKPENMRVDLVKRDVTRKKILIEECGTQCQVCKLKEWMGKEIPIQLDHVDGNPDNNARENLRLLCPNCHAQTETFTGKNKGTPSLRNSYRKKYYKPSQGRGHGVQPVSKTVG